MLRVIGNLIATRLATRGTKKSGLIGKVVKLGVARKISSRRGATGALAKVGVGLGIARITLGAMTGIGAVVAGVIGARRVMAGRSSEEETPQA